jgi:hypothetical protein
MPAKRPDIKLAIKRPVGPQGKTWWAPVGEISLWQDDATGKWSGTCHIFFWGMEFKVFEKEEKREEAPTP